MISEMVRTFNPDGQDQANPPDLAPLLDASFENYLPLIIQ
jgi:hypothetical protein